LTFLAIAGAGSAQDDPLPERSLPAPLAPRSLKLDAVAIEGALVAVGERGHILISSDRGESWLQAEVPTRSALTGAWFHDRDRGWAVGHDSVIVRSLDGGVTWERVHWAPEEESPLLDVWFSDAENGFAVGAYGSFYVTSDGGASWAFRPIGEDDFHLNHLAEADDGTLFIAAEAGMIYRSDDRGESWSELPSPYAGSFFGTLPLSGDSVLLFGLQGHLFRSDDAGESWTELETGTTAMLTDGIRTAGGTVLISGLGGVVLISHDGGHTFERHQQPDRRGISALVEVDDETLFMTGEFGVKLLSASDLTR
jgi:photosystem II stability/assembly factor-like uncharacterized protein